jgi:hypothetical protein
MQPPMQFNIDILEQVQKLLEVCKQLEEGYSYRIRKVSIELLQDVISDLKKYSSMDSSRLSTISEHSTHELNESNSSKYDGWDIGDLEELYHGDLDLLLKRNDPVKQEQEQPEKPEQATIATSSNSRSSIRSIGSKKTFQSFVRQCKLPDNISLYYGTVEFKLCTRNKKPSLFHVLPSGKVLESTSPSGALQLYEQQVNRRHIGINGWHRLKMKLKENEFHSIGWNHWDQYVWNEQTNSFVYAV